MKKETVLEHLKSLDADALEIDALAAHTRGKVRALQEELNNLEKDVIALDKRAVSLRKTVNRLQSAINKTPEEERVGLKVVGS